MIEAKRVEFRLKRPAQAVNSKSMDSLRNTHRLLYLVQTKETLVCGSRTNEGIEGILVNEAKTAPILSWEWTKHWHKIVVQADTRTVTR